MSDTLRLLIANGFSVISAVFTVLSSLSHTSRKIYGYQALQCAVMAVASIFFLSYSGITTFLLCTARNLFLMKDKFNKYVMVVFLLLTVGLGLYFNNRGVIGLIPIVTTVVYILGCYFLKKVTPIKWNITLNLTLWGIYDFLVLDIVSGVIDSITAIVTVAAIFKDHRAQQE